MTITHAADGGSANVRFAVWSEQGGQDDMQWYTAAKDASGAWTYKVDLTKHNTVGKYNIHVYAGSTYLGSYTANVAKLAVTSGVKVSEDCKTMTITHAGGATHSLIMQKQIGC